MKTMIQKMLETLKQLLARIEEQTNKETNVSDKPEKKVNTEKQESPDGTSKRNRSQTMTVQLR